MPIYLKGFSKLKKSRSLSPLRDKLLGRVIKKDGVFPFVMAFVVKDIQVKRDNIISGHNFRETNHA